MQARGIRCNYGDLVTTISRSHMLLTDIPHQRGGRERRRRSGAKAMRTARLTVRLTAMAAIAITLAAACSAGTARARPAAASSAPARRPIMLTFDDGPDPVWTPRLLGVLQSHHVRAVFCVTGEHAAMWPELVRQIVAKGNTLCVHSWHHPHLLTVPKMVQRQEIQRTQALLISLVGRAPVKYWRAPYGQSSAALDAYARSLGLVPLGWNAEGSDWTPGVTPATIERLENADLARTPLRQWAMPPGNTPPGVAVVLLHDALGENHTRGSVERWATVATVLALIQHHTVSPP